VRDIVLVCFILAFFVAAFKRPYFLVLGYIWVDFLQPQKLTYWFLNGAPLALVMAAGAFIYYLMFDQKQRLRLSTVQVLIIIFAFYATVSTFTWAVLFDHAYEKWDWVWKGFLFAVFLPFVLSTRRRVEAALFTMTLSLAAITISGGIKTLLGSGGYGNVSFLVVSNTGLFEGSTLATVSLAFIPVTLWLYRNNSIMKKSMLTLLATAGIIFSMTLVTVGAEARTGLIAGAVLALLLWLGAKRKLLLGAAMVAAVIASIPLLPQSFKDRMSTVKTYDEDVSASTRLAVWAWTIDYVKEHPLGGGFGVYRINSFNVEVKKREGEEGNQDVSTTYIKKNARAFHNSFFEVLGEMGYPGIILYLSILVLGIRTAWSLRGVTTGDPSHDGWYRDLGKMLSISMITYFVGAMFVGIAFQPFYYYLLAVAISAGHLAQRERVANNLETRISVRPPRRARPVPAE
jgi:probable O-glycosylation ligase (exosortase A-associated)